MTENIEIDSQQHKLNSESDIQDQNQQQDQPIQINNLLVQHKKSIQSQNISDSTQTQLYNKQFTNSVAQVMNTNFNQQKDLDKFDYSDNKERKSTPTAAGVMEQLKKQQHAESQKQFAPRQSSPNVGIQVKKNQNFFQDNQPIQEESYFQSQSKNQSQFQSENDMNQKKQDVENQNMSVNQQKLQNVNEEDNQQISEDQNEFNVKQNQPGLQNKLKIELPAVSANIKYGNLSEQINNNTQQPSIQPQAEFEISPSFPNNQKQQLTDKENKDKTKSSEEALLQLNKDKNQKVEKKKWKVKMEQFLDNKYVGIIISLLTIYALWGDDFRVMVFEQSADIVFNILIIICFTVFSIEIILSMVAKDKYCNSFFFYLDVISTITLILDLTWVAASLFSNTTTNASNLARAGRASRIGTRAGRIVRLVRLVRIVKLFKQAQKKKGKLTQAQLAAQAAQQKKQQKAENLKSEENSKKQAKIGGIPNNKNINNEQSSQINKVYPEKDEEKDRLNKESIGFYKFDIDDTNKMESGARSPTRIAYLKKKSGIMSPGKSILSPLRLQHQRTQNQLNEVIDERIDEIEEEEEETKESRVSQLLSQLTTKRVIILVLALLICLPVFESDYFFDPEMAFLGDIQIMGKIAEGTVNSTYPVSVTQIDTAYDQFVAKHKHGDHPLLYFSYPISQNRPVFNISYSNLRIDEIQTITFNSSVINLLITCTVSMRTSQITQSILNFFKTIYVCIVLVAGSMMFSADANKLALRPIEKMIEKVNMIAQNPLSAKYLEVSADDKNETSIISNAIIKIGVLLALGFGEAGSSIIASNMAQGGDVQPLLPGQKKCAIFGFCDIRSFTEATEVLQEDVMQFVNKVAKIVHKNVDRYGGSTNKNIGDAFLLVWKFPESTYKMVDDMPQLERSSKIKNIADMSVLSFLKVLSGINKKPEILAYKEHKLLCERLPNFAIKMGFGLHVGWAIEGAIGSQFKIDASYLSPNVNLASRLEAATKQFGVQMLISGELQRLLSKKCQRLFRQIDYVTVKGSKNPMKLFTVDLNFENLKPSLKLNLEDDQEKKNIRFLAKQFFDDIIEFDLGYKVNTFFTEEPDLATILVDSYLPFKEDFAKGFQCYLDGHWDVAKVHFNKVFEQKPKDGPTTTLMNVLQDFNFKAPATWPGFRELTEK